MQPEESPITSLHETTFPHQGHIATLEQISSNMKSIQHNSLIKNDSDEQPSQLIKLASADDFLKPSTFYRFTDLPVEIQLTIWDYARHPARVIKPMIREEEDGTLQVWSSAPVPTLLQVCSQSRQHALKWYTLTLSINPRPAARIYFDYSRDYLNYCLPWHCSCPAQSKVHGCWTWKSADFGDERVRYLYIRSTGMIRRMTKIELVFELWQFFLSFHREVLRKQSLISSVVRLLSTQFDQLQSFRSHK